MARSLPSLRVLVVLLLMVAWQAPGVCASESSISEKRAGELFRASKFSEAEAIYRSERDAAEQRGDLKAELRLTSNLAGCRFAQLDYREAVRLYRKVVERASQAGEGETAGVAYINLSSVYSALWEPDASEMSIREAGRWLRPGNRFFAIFKAQEAAMEARRQGYEASLDSALSAAAAADAGGDSSLMAQVWDGLGRLAMATGRTDEAEAYLVEAYRLRLLLKLPMLESSYRSLARLRLKQGRSGEALTLVRQAESSRKTAPSRGAFWAWEADKAAVLAANGDFDGARRTYRDAISRARRWRASILPSQTSVLAAEVSSAEIAEDYAGILAAAADGRGGAAEMIEALEVIETSRADAVRAELMAASWRQERLGLEYARALRQLRRLEAKLLAGVTPETEAEARRWRAEVASIESRMDPGAPADGEGGEPRLLKGAFRPRGEELWLSFKLGQERSWMWVVTQNGVRMEALPGEAAIAVQAEALRTSIAKEGEWRAPAARLYRTLFSGLTKEERGRRRWIVSLDGALHGVPLAAALEPGESGKEAKPLAARVQIQAVPSLLSIRRSGQRSLAGARFVGVGDAVYNLADQRLGARRTRFALPWFAMSVSAKNDGQDWDLPRLPGSGDELRAAADVLAKAGVRPRLLTGPEARMEILRRELQGGAAMVHLAGHVLVARGEQAKIGLDRAAGESGGWMVRPGEVFFAMGRGAGGEQELLSRAAVSAQMSAEGALVVLSGCGSASGEVLPGVGLQGLSRAWLAARASVVVGSLWPQPDSSLEFFAPMYKAMARGETVAASIQAAQIAMIESKDWRNHPRHWSGWVLLGKEL